MMTTTTEAETAKAKGVWAGVMHRNSMAIAARGPWRIDGIVCRPMKEESRVALADGCELIVQHGGTCECCGMPICNIVTLRSASERITLGLDCAKTLDANGGLDARAARALNTAEAKLRRERAAKAKARKTAKREATIAENKASAETRFAAELAILDAAVARLEPGWAKGFASDVASKIRNGLVSELSPKQTEWIHKIGAM